MARRAPAYAELLEAGKEDWAGIRSPVVWALLGLVIAREDYGYGLVKRFQRDYADVLQIKSDWHIYRALDGLKSKNLIEEIPGSDADQSEGARQPKPHYRATADGVCHYADWLAVHSAPARRQSRLFARQLAMLGDRPELALEVLNRYERTCLSEPVSGLPRTRGGAGAARLAELLAAEESRLHLAATLPWLQYARAQLERMLAAKRDSDALP